MAEIKLNSTLSESFADISSETARTYVFPKESLPDGRIREQVLVTIVHPQWLHVSQSGGHRILDVDGVSHYIPCGWKHLFWGVKEGKPNFVK